MSIGIPCGKPTLCYRPAESPARRDAGTFDAVGLWDWDDTPVAVVVDGEPESVASADVTPEVLPMLGAHPVHGRGFTEADAQPGAEPTLMLSHDDWQRRFGGADRPRLREHDVPQLARMQEAVRAP